MAQLVYMKDPRSDDEGVVIDTEDTSEEKLNEEYAPLKVNQRVRLPDDCSGMPTDRLLVAE
jgi:hypothetical protein